MTAKEFEDEKESQDRYRIFIEESKTTVLGRCSTVMQSDDCSVQFPGAFANHSPYHNNALIKRPAAIQDVSSQTGNSRKLNPIYFFMYSSTMSSTCLPVITN